MTGRSEMPGHHQPREGQESGGGGGSVHVGRPLLTFVGEKLYSGWMQRFLDGTLPYNFGTTITQATIGHYPLSAPSVFNFYPPNYPAPGTTIDGPPFKLMLTGTILNRANFVDRIVNGNAIAADTATSVTASWSRPVSANE